MNTYIEKLTVVIDKLSINTYNSPVVPIAKGNAEYYRLHYFGGIDLGGNVYTLLIDEVAERFTTTDCRPIFKLYKAQKGTLVLLLDGHVGYERFLRCTTPRDYHIHLTRDNAEVTLPLTVDFATMRAIEFIDLLADLKTRGYM